MPATTPQAERLRADLASLTVLAEHDLAEIWRGFDSPEVARETLTAVLPEIVSLYGSAAATVAADWYDELRDQDAVTGRYRAAAAPLPDDTGTAVLARWGLSPVFAAAPDWAAALTLTQGGTQRRIVNMARSTITGSAVNDPAAHGWQRVGSGECSFCEMVISRGAVYRQATADFASHDHCRCAAVPAWGGRPHPVKPYTPTRRDISDADRARVREYLRTH